MMSSIDTIAKVNGSPGVTGRRTMSVAEQVAVDVEMAAEAVARQELSPAGTERVRRLRAAIEKGRYFVSSEELAGKMMSAMFGGGGIKVQ